MAKVTEKLKLTLPSPEDRIDIDVLNGNYEILENQIYSNLIKKKTSISEESSFGEVIPPYVTITNTNLDAVNVTVGEEKVTIPAASTITVAIKEKKELSIDTDGVIAVEYFMSNERYANEQSGSAVDSELSEASENPVQNKVITAKFKEYYNSEEVDELIGGIGAPEDVYTKTETDNLLSAKANKSDTYTKTETDNKITEKVSEIVSGAPEDFDTLKEMSDWLIEHEGSAAEMNTAIQQNKTDILSANAEIAKKVDKVSGKSLISDSEIERLAGVDNYDDTSVNAQIAVIYDDYIGGKNLLNPDRHTRARCTEVKDGNTYTVTSTGTWSQWAWKFRGLSGQTYTLTFEISELTGDTSKNDAYIADVNSGEKIRWFTIRGNGAQTINFTATSDGDINIAFNPNYTDTVKDISFKVSNLMCRSTKIKSKSYAPYRPTVDELQDQLNALTARIAALEGTATTAESGEA